MASSAVGGEKAVASRGEVDTFMKIDEFNTMLLKGYKILGNK